MLKRWMTMGLLTLGILSWPCTGTAIEKVPAGWQAPTTGYFLTEAEGRETVSALQERRLVARTWEAAYSDLRQEFQETEAQFEARLDSLEESINMERDARNAELRRTTQKSLTYGIIIGIVGAIVAGG